MHPALGVKVMAPWIAVTDISRAYLELWCVQTVWGIHSDKLVLLSLLLVLILCSKLYRGTDAVMKVY